MVKIESVEQKQLWKPGELGPLAWRAAAYRLEPGAYSLARATRLGPGPTVDLTCLGLPSLALSVHSLIDEL